MQRLANLKGPTGTLRECGVGGTPRVDGAAKKRSRTTLPSSEASRSYMQLSPFPFWQWGRGALLPVRETKNLKADSQRAASRATW